MVAVGCTDNSVRLWSMKKSCIVLEVSSSGQSGISLVAFFAGIVFP